MDPEDIVHDAMLRILNAERPIPFRNTEHFMVVAARAMRRFLIDQVRASKATKADGGIRVDLESVALHLDDNPILRLQIGQALARLQCYNGRLHRVLVLRVFVGLSLAETAERLALSARTVKRDWRAAQQWLAREINGPSPR